jgi:hypothetical protein
VIHCFCLRKFEGTSLAITDFGDKSQMVTCTTTQLPIVGRELVLVILRIPCCSSCHIPVLSLVPEAAKITTRNGSYPRIVHGWFHCAGRRWGSRGRRALESCFALATSQCIRAEARIDTAQSMAPASPYPHDPTGATAEWQTILQQLPPLLVGLSVEHMILLHAVDTFPNGVCKPPKRFFSCSGELR